MNTKEILEKINKRNKYVMTCGTAQNDAYLKYLTSSSKYDTLKKGFYTAMDLSKLDGDVPDEQLQGYARSIKYFDKELLKQFKERNYQIQKILIDDIQNAPYKDRIMKIETEGLSRNELHFEFIDNKENYEKAKILFYKEISLGVKDGLISDIAQNIYCGSMKGIEKKLEEELMQHKQNFIKNRKNQEKRIKEFNGEYVKHNGGRSRGRRYDGRGYVRGYDAGRNYDSFVREGHGVESVRNRETVRGRGRGGRSRGRMRGRGYGSNFIGFNSRPY